jgi:hypothetical protein
MSHQGKTYARAARDGVGNVRKSRSLLHLTSKEKSSKTAGFAKL